MEEKIICTDLSIPSAAPVGVRCAVGLRTSGMCCRCWGNSCEFIRLTLLCEIDNISIAILTVNIVSVKCPKCQFDNTSDSKFCKFFAALFTAIVDIEVTEILEIVKKKSL